MSVESDTAPAVPPVVPGHGSGQLEDLLAEPYPRMLMVQTTSRCNSRCMFCPHAGLRDQLPQGEMAQPLFESILREAGRHAGHVACVNLFLMNEPLMDPRLVERVHFAGRQVPGAQISLWTNGVALSARTTERLLDSPLTSLGVSLHAHRAETYRRITGRRDFARVLRNLVNFVERRNVRRPDLAVVLRYVGAGMLQAEGEAEELIAFWRDGNVALDIDDGYLSRAGNLEAPAAVAEPRRWMAGCQALGGPKQAHILYTGQLVLCCMDYRRQTDLGDLTRDSLSALWSGPRRRAALEQLYGVRPAATDFLCARCELAIPGCGPPDSGPRV